MPFGVQNRCRWDRSSPDVLDLYAAADVVSPSRVSDYIHDALDGIVLREPREAQTQSQLIERLQAESDLRRKVGEAASQTILEPDWNRNAARPRELLKNA